MSQLERPPYNSTVLTFESTVHSSRKHLEKIKLFSVERNPCHFVCFGFDAHIFARRSTTYERTGRSQILQGQKNVGFAWSSSGSEKKLFKLLLTLRNPLVAVIARRAVVQLLNKLFLSKGPFSSPRPKGGFTLLPRPLNATDRPISPATSTFLPGCPLLRWSVGGRDQRRKEGLVVCSFEPRK